MFYSGLVVTCRTGDVESVYAALTEMPRVEVHQIDRRLGRIVVVLEEESIDAETEQFRRIQTLPNVVDVSLVVHREEREEPPPSDSLHTFDEPTPQ